MDIMKITSEDLKKTGMTQEEIAHKIGCAQSTISHWINGKRKMKLSYVPALKLKRIIENKNKR